MTYYNVATAASITGFVRAHLLRAIAGATNPIYCDTDSVFADATNVPLSDALGDWSVEATCAYGAFAERKLYAALTTTGTWKKASKGARLTPLEITAIAQGKTVVYHAQTPTMSLSKLAPEYLTRTYN